MPSMVLVSSEGPRSWVCCGGAGLPCGAHGRGRVRGRRTSLGLDPEIMPTVKRASPFQLFLLPFLLGGGGVGQTVKLGGVKINSLN